MPAVVMVLHAVDGPRSWHTTISVVLTWASDLHWVAGHQQAKHVLQTDGAAAVGGRRDRCEGCSAAEAALAAARTEHAGQQSPAPGIHFSGECSRRSNGNCTGSAQIVRLGPTL